ncbi:MAG: hypothetical protein MUO19_05370 [Dehalococcoidales bacterium]|nr:hypothetical protein [Dehalococcoidales bacterium]
MGEIKSAAEIAKEKLAAIGEPTEEERLKWKYGPEGEKLAARYLREDVNLSTEIAAVDEKGRPVVMAGVNGILLRNISLPRNEADRKTTKKAMDGLKDFKKDKVAVENVFSKMRHVLDHYVKEGKDQRKQAYEQLQDDFEQKLQEAIRAQTGASNAARMKIDVEKQPQFQEEWQRLQAQLEAQYLNLLDEYKQELATLK